MILIFYFYLLKGIDTIQTVSCFVSSTNSLKHRQLSNLTLKWAKNSRHSLAYYDLEGPMKYEMDMDIEGGPLL